VTVQLSEHNRPEKIAAAFYAFLREEVTHGNPYLNRDGQRLLQGHYPFMMDPQRYPPDLIATLYVSRRAYPVQSILGLTNPWVFDAGCGYGSDSFLFAALGAKVIAVDVSADQVEIAKKRKRYYEESFGRSLDITFRTADLNDYTVEKEDVSLTWLASVLAVIRDQERFLSQVYEASRIGGRVIVVDFNLLNPVFLWSEWRRRRRALVESPEFARQARFWRMVRRRQRLGARFFPCPGGGSFDDVQFFTPKSLAYLIKKVGFRLLKPGFSGFAPPVLFGRTSHHVERLCSRLPGLNHLGRAYVVSGVK
jgi:SAM-dependent methyltransferase